MKMSRNQMTILVKRLLSETEHKISPLYKDPFSDKEVMGDATQRELVFYGVNPDLVRRDPKALAYGIDDRREIGVFDNPNEERDLAFIQMPSVEKVHAMFEKDVKQTIFDAAKDLPSPIRNAITGNSEPAAYSASALVDFGGIVGPDEIVDKLGVLDDIHLKASSAISDLEDTPSFKKLDPAKREDQLDMINAGIDDEILQFNEQYSYIGDRFVGPDSPVYFVYSFYASTIESFKLSLNDFMRIDKMSGRPKRTSEAVGEDVYVQLAAMVYEEPNFEELDDGTVREILDDAPDVIIDVVGVAVIPIQNNEALLNLLKMR